MTSIIRLDATPTPRAGAPDNFVAIPTRKTRRSSGKGLDQKGKNREPQITQKN